MIEKRALVSLVVFLASLLLAQSTPVRVERLEPIQRVEPKWDGRTEGTVKLDVTIDAKGEVTGSQVIEGDPRLRKISQEAVKKYRFTPPKVDGIPATAITQVTFVYRHPVPKSLQPMCSVVDASVVQTSADGAQFVCVPNKDVHEHLIRQVSPERPGSLLSSSIIQTATEVRVLVGADGKVVRVEPIDDPARRALADAVRQWVFKPFSVNGKNYPAWIVVEVFFD